MDKDTQTSAPMTREEMLSALFANMVLQQTNMAMMFLGRIPHPESGQPVKDLEMAQMFIDQLEMLESKTRNNLDKQEERLLKQSLTAIRMAFVEAVNEPQPAPAPSAGGRASAGESATDEAAPAQAGESPGDTDESRKKFTKKY